MIHRTSHRFASPAVSHRVLEDAFIAAFPHSTSSRGNSRPAPLRSASLRSARRRGQALLIAVLLMVFAAVLGATFVTVVALNLQQTARSGSVNTARVAAIAGRNYVNEQLTNSPLGENWRPQLDASQPSAADDTYYFTDFERAQGWNQPDAASETVGGYRSTPSPTPITTNPQFVKFPDPRSTSITGNNTPTFLTKVEKVTDGSERDGQLKVTVIGRASDNDAAYSTLVFYKPTSQNGSMFSFARYDSNWNFRTNNLVKTAISSDSTVDNEIFVNSITGLFPGRTILIGSADDPTNVRAAIISRVIEKDPNDPNITINQVNVTQVSGPPGPVRAIANQPVRAASPYVGGLPNIDAQGTENPLALQDTATPSQYDDVLSAPNPSSGGILINNGLLLQGKSQFALNTTGTRPDRVLVAGPVSIQGGANTFANVRNGDATEDIKATSVLTPFVRYQQSEANDPTDRNQVVRPLTPARLDLPNSRWLQKTKLTGDEGAFYGYGAGIYIDNKEDFEAVQENKPNTDGTAVITTFRKMTISEIQRLLMRKSLSAIPNSAPNFIINHTLPGGIVRTETYDPAPGNTDLQPEPLTFPGYRNAAALVVPPNTPPSVNPNTFNRLSFARIGVDNYQFPIRDVYPDQPFSNIGSLEQRGVRGWNSPYEFLPRGALIELRGNEIVITRDDMSDASEKIATNDIAYPDGYANNPKYDRPDEFKAWKNPNGTPLTNPGARTYRMKIDIATGQRFLGAPGNEVAITPLLGGNKPFNGVIYAEGNVRVRGHLAKDVTIVSMGTIYIEGGINKVGGHVALLAKRNAVLNPTQFAARPAGLQVPDLNPGANIPVGLPVVSSDPTVVVSVDEVSAFRVGDRVRIGVPELRLMISNISGVSGPGTITLLNPSTPDPFTGIPAPTQLNAAAGTRVLVVGDASLSNGAKQKAYTVGNYSRDLLRDGAQDPAGPPTPLPYHLSIVHAGQLTPGAQMTSKVAPGTVEIKQETTVDGIIKALDEKKLAASGSGVRDLATTNLGDLATSFATDPNWGFNLFGATPATSAHRLAAVKAEALAPTISRSFLLTTSIGGYWQNSATPNFVIGSGFLPADDEEARTVQETFYGAYDATLNTFTQADFLGMTYLFPAIAPAAPAPDGDNSISLRRAVAPTETLANDLVVGIKYDRDTFANVAFSPVNVNVQATIYAQDGSWLVIPMPAMTSRPANPLAPDPIQVDQANRYRRLNYKITVKANIAENFAPTGLFDYDNEQTPDQTPTLTPSPGLGAQALWLDSSSYPVNDLGTTWQSINYLAPDPLPFDNNLYLPMTPDIIDQR